MHKPSIFDTSQTKTVHAQKPFAPTALSEKERRDNAQADSARPNNQGIYNTRDRSLRPAFEQGSMPSAKQGGPSITGPPGSMRHAGIQGSSALPKTQQSSLPPRPLVAMKPALMSNPSMYAPPPMANPQYNRPQGPDKSMLPYSAPP